MIDEKQARRLYELRKRRHEAALAATSQAEREALRAGEAAERAHRHFMDAIQGASRTGTFETGEIAHAHAHARNASRQVELARAAAKRALSIVEDSIAFAAAARRDAEQMDELASGARAARLRDEAHRERIQEDEISSIRAARR